KIAALEANIRQLEKAMADLAGQIQRQKTAENEVKSVLDTISKLEEYRNFQELDWAPLAIEIEHLTDELRRLEGASDLQQTLTQTLQQLERERRDCEQELEDAKKELHRTELKKEQAESLQRDIRVFLDSPEQQSGQA